ncbi:MAG TPA: 2-amino-4-hydroxy-6-hydroxymethyldihydropteridine diphosphokinase [Chitinophagaceae bacterium]|nr:2-amino-4-hydroxy-6-hydroxymethyldihydropteridine diphosphokinase [Chitinophagaceae bacterium]
MNKAYLLTGGNLGNRLNNLDDAAKLIEQYCGKIVQQSSIYKTAAWGFKDQPDFYNQVLAITTNLSPEQLMQKLLAIEEKMGRKREVKMGPRIIDIDILLFNDEIIHQSHLSIPHPRLHERRFALTPLAEIAPNIIHPVLHKTSQELLLECSDTLDVHKMPRTP